MTEAELASEPTARRTARRRRRAGVPPRRMRSRGRRDVFGRLASSLDQAADIRLLELAHELRQPLTIASLSAQMMLRRGSYDDHALSRILDATGRLDRMVADLYRAAGATDGPPVLIRADVDLVALAAEAVDHAGLLTSAHAIRLEAPADPVVGWWDADHLAEVLDNLIGNAIKHTAGGEIVVRVESLGSTVRVAVLDHGNGIPPDVLPRIFDRFFRAVSASGGPAGEGLGLYLCRSLVEAHGGRIWAKSTPGVGSTFAFELPRDVRKEIETPSC